MAHKYRDLTKRVADLEFVAPPEEVITIKSEIFGFFRVGKRADPSGVFRSKPCFVKSLKLDAGKWVETDEPYTVTLPIKMEKVLRAIGRKRFIVLIGGRGSGKSQGVTDICADRMQRKSKIGFFREFANSIEDSTHPLLAEEIERLGMQGFRVLKREIEHRSGGIARFKGLARNVSSVKGMALFNIFATDEAQTVSEKSLKVMTPTMRSHGGAMIFCANPGSAADPFSQRFIVPYIHRLDDDGIYEDDLHLIIRLNHDDNPFFPMSLEEERKFDETYLSAAMYDHVWNGAFDDSVEDAIIPAEWFDAAIDAHRRLQFAATGQRAAALDPADVGNDNKAYIETHGGVIVDYADSWFTGDANDAGDRAITYVKDHGVSAFAWDISGLGAGLRRQLTDGLLDRVVGAYNGGSGVNRPDDPVEMDNWLLKGRHATGDNVLAQKDLFMNRRSQDAYLLRRRFEKTYLYVKKGIPAPFDELISISSELPKEVLTRMRSEVCRVPRVYNAAGKFQVMPKPEMKKKLKIPSPGLFDCLLMLQQPPEPDYAPQAADGWRSGSNY